MTFQLVLAARRRKRPRQPPAVTRQPQKKKQQQQRTVGGFPGRLVAWIAGVLGAGLAAALGVWLSGLGHSALSLVDRGPALTATADVFSPSPKYVLTTAVISRADRLTLLGGFATGTQVLSVITRHGGVPIGSLDLILDLQGHRSGLRVIDIAPQVVPSGKAPTAAFLAFPQEGTEPIIPVSADMDQAFPALDSGGVPYFSGHDIDLANGENETFKISFTASSGFREFRLIVTYVTGGKQYQQAVSGPDAPGGPDSEVFELAGQGGDSHDYSTVYYGLSDNQFQVASAAQDCSLFPKSRGC